MMGKYRIKEWIVATRPWSFSASAMLVLLMLAYLEWRVGGVRWLYGLWAVGAVMLFHAAGNTWSDWHDYRRGIDAADTHGVDTLTSGRFAPETLRNYSLALYGIACALGLGLMLCVGWPLLGIGLGGLLGAVFYPPLKYRALGDVVIMLNYCVLPALGTSYVALGQFELDALWVALPIGLLVDAILHANNTRDMRTDRRAGACTLAHVLGVRGAVCFYLFDTFFPFIWVIALALYGTLPLWCVLVVQLLPLAWRNGRQMHAYRSEADAAAIPTLDQASAKLQLLFCAVLIFNLFLDIWLR